jgi:hypothetical protein
MMVYMNLLNEILNPNNIKINLGLKQIINQTHLDLK